MTSKTNTVNPLAIIGAIVATGVLVMLASTLPSRMPPDPFEEDELREVILEVEWDGDQRGQLIAWDVGDDEDEIHTDGMTNEGPSGWYWKHITTAREGTMARLSAIQDGPGPILCAIYVDERQIAVDQTASPYGCFTEAAIP